MSTHPDDGSKPKRSLPPELAFLQNIPERMAGLENDELLAFMRNQVALIRQHAGLIRAQGMDPDHMVGLIEPSLVAAEQANKICEETNEKLLHAMADSADAQRELFKQMSATVERVYEERPFDPQVQEMKEFVDEWRKEMPKGEV